MADHLTDVLRAHGLRVTAARLAVLETLRGQSHVAADVVADGSRRRLGTLSTQAVYDTLHTFTAVGLIRRIDPAGSAAVYETRVGDNHHHVVCRLCGAIADVDCAVGSAPCLSPDQRNGPAHGFTVDEAEVTYWGLCPDCSKERELP
jgi:Fe2+ or Zn2+ uptake regulation protein